MAYSLKQAAAACGRSKSSVYDAIKNNKLKHKKDEKGHILIEPDDLTAVSPKHPENVYSGHEQTPPNAEKHSLFLQTIESLKNTVAALEADRDRWHKAHQNAQETIAQQAAALATASAASARAITQADEMRRQMAAIEAPKPAAQPLEAEPPQPAAPAPASKPQPTANRNDRPAIVRPWLLVALALAALLAAGAALYFRQQ